MSKKHEKVLAAIFTDPISGNIHWREVESMLSHFGAQFGEAHGARVLITLNGREHTLHRPHHGSAMGKSELHHLRSFLAAAGLTPSSTE